MSAYPKPETLDPIPHAKGEDRDDLGEKMDVNGKVSPEVSLPHA